MSVFEMYFKLGFDHIADLNGYDHILFITVLCGIYLLKQWKHVLILVTAFTIGHSITLLLATLKIMVINEGFIEFLIPLTIFLTAVFNLFFKHNSSESKKLHYIKYFSALFFGLIHGLGFSNYLRSLLGMEKNITLPLFAFNLGLEIGQIIIVFCILFLSFLFVKKFRVLQREWNLTVSGMGLGISLILMIERFPL